MLYFNTRSVDKRTSLLETSDSTELTARQRVVWWLWLGEQAAEGKRCDLKNQGSPAGCPQPPRGGGCSAPCGTEKLPYHLNSAYKSCLSSWEIRVQFVAVCVHLCERRLGDIAAK